MDLAKLIQEYSALNLQDVIDHDRFNEYAIVHHSTTIKDLPSRKLKIKAIA